MSKAGSRMLEGARAALAYATGEADQTKYGFHNGENNNVLLQAMREFERISKIAKAHPRAKRSKTRPSRNALVK